MAIAKRTNLQNSVLIMNGKYHKIKAWSLEIPEEAIKNVQDN